MTAAELFNANQATTTVSSGGTDAPSGGTQETWTVASSLMFGTAATGISQFHVADPVAPSEVIAVTNVSGTTWTVTRGAESTTPVTHSAGFTVYQVVTTGFLSTLGAGTGTVTSVTATDTSIVVGGTPTAAPTIATGTLDVVATQHPPAANWSNNSHKITSLANGSGAQDAAAYGQTPAGGNTVTIGEGGTGQVTQQAAMDALAGATTSGDYLRGSGTHVLMSAIQAGDVPGFDGVTVTGTPSSGQVPVATSSSAASWQTPSLPVVTFTYGSSGAVPSSGTYTTGTAVVDQNDIVRICTASGTPGTWVRDGALPWQFWVGDYGALGNGKIVGDAAMTSSTATLTSATANFTSGDAGKNIVVNGALGNSSAPLYTTILSVTNSTTIVLNANATNTVSSAAAFWASDDSAAIVSCITAASTYAYANNWKCQVRFQAKSYGLATLTTTTAGGSLAQQNALVPIPYPNVNGTTQKLSFELVGVGENADQQYFDSTIPCVNGTALVATVAASGTNPGIIGGPNSSSNLTGTWANVKGVIKGISAWAGFNPGWIAFDLHQLASCWVDNCCANVLAPQSPGQLPISNTIPSNGSGIGLWMAANNDCGAGRVLVWGYYKAVNLSTRNTIEKLLTSAAFYGALALTVNGSVIHGARIGYWSCQGVTNGLASIGTSGTMAVVVDLMDTTSTVTTDLNDPHGTLVGNVNWYHDVSTTPNVTAGFAMKITNLRLNPGPMSSPPSPPSSGSPSTGIFRDTHITLSVTGGSLTALTIDSVDQNIPAGCVLWSFTLPSGHTFTPTYTGTLANDVTVI